MDLQECFIIALDADSKTFVLHMAIKKQKKILVHSERQVQIQVRALIFDKTFIAISTEYSNYNNVFSRKNAAKLLEYIEINNHAIKLEESKQLPFGPIYSLRLVDLKTLKTYIKTNLGNNFIQPSTSLTSAPILFD